MGTFSGGDHGGGRGRGDDEDDRSGLMTVISECMTFIGFRLEIVTPHQVAGRFVVSKAACQPYNVLHGGVSALIAETLASHGAFLASGRRRVAGLELNINHMKAAPIGTEVFASAEPIHLGQRSHVWEVILWKVPNASAGQKMQQMGPGNTKIAVSRITLMVGLDKGPSEPSDQATSPLSKL